MYWLSTDLNDLRNHVRFLVSFPCNSRVKKWGWIRWSQAWRVSSMSRIDSQEQKLQKEDKCICRENIGHNTYYTVYSCAYKSLQKESWRIMFCELGWDSRSRVIKQRVVVIKTDAWEACLFLSDSLHACKTCISDKVVKDFRRFSCDTRRDTREH